MSWKIGLLKSANCPNRQKSGWEMSWAPKVWARNVLENGPFEKRQLSQPPKVRTGNILSANCPYHQMSRRQMSWARNFPGANCPKHQMSRGIMSWPGNVPGAKNPSANCLKRQMSGAEIVPAAKCLKCHLSRAPNFQAPNVPAPFVSREKAAAKCTTTDLGAKCSEKMPSWCWLFSTKMANFITNSRTSPKNVFWVRHLGATTSFF